MDSRHIVITEGNGSGPARYICLTGFCLCGRSKRIARALKPKPKQKLGKTGLPPMPKESE